MLSRAERARRVAEWTLRGIALASLAVLLWRALRPPANARVHVARADVEAALERWTVSPAAERHVVFDATPEPRTRDWFRALARAGDAVRWSSVRPLGAGAIAAEPAFDPDAATTVRLVSSPGEAVSVADAAGLIDTLPRGGAVALELATVEGALTATAATFKATAASRDSVVLRPVLVVGAAGWESKFTVAALEERGWRVAARARVAPNVDVTQGPLGAIDTARYSAVIVLDSTGVSLAPNLSRYARSGGGVILAGSAARFADVALIAPGGVGRRVAGVAGAVASGSPRGGLSAFPIASLRPDAVPLESRDAAPVVAARRVDAGRVLQSGYDETWRWRMSGGEGAASAHREWWSRLVAAVAYAPVVARSGAPAILVDETPYASLIHALGPAMPLDTRLTRSTDPLAVDRMLFALALVSLLAEWTSRRLRGAR